MRNRNHTACNPALLASRTRIVAGAIALRAGIFKLAFLALGFFALGALTPLAQGVSPSPDGFYPGFNTAEGQNALLSLNTGTGFANTAVGWLSLRNNVNGSFNTGLGAGTLALDVGNPNTNEGVDNTAVGAAALILNTTGSDNTATGTATLVNNSGGNGNTAVGSFALNSNTSGSFSTATGFGALAQNNTNANTADGALALSQNTTGFANTAVGGQALQSNRSGSDNTATGFQALLSNTASDHVAYGYQPLLHNVNGHSNTAIGSSALLANTGGTQNTAVGIAALSSVTIGNFNTAVGGGAGASVTDASNVICIGSVGENISGSCFIGNIREVQTGVNDAINVVIDSAGQLGTQSSSQRFKKDVKPMDKVSESILALKPVTFHYKKDEVNRSQFGLIAEEVAAVNPDLVVRDENGEIYSVRYDAVNAMLLNEFLKEHKKVEEQQSKIDQQQATIAELKSTVVQQQKGMEILAVQIKEQGAQIQNVSAQMQLNSAGHRVVVSDQ